jgi:hypothetical protein
VRQELHRTIADALPKRLAHEDRERITAYLVNHMSRWRKDAPRVADRRRRERELAPVADQLRRVLEKVIDELKRPAYRLKQSLEELLALRPTEQSPLHLEGWSAWVDLYLIACTGLVLLEHWNQRYRAKARRPRAPATDLLEQVRVLSNRLTRNEFASLLEAINSTGAFPALSTETLHSRRRRGFKLARKSL